MEWRKLMAFGQSSFIISVPKAWVEKNRLKKGDALAVETRPGEMVISVQGGDERRQSKEAAIECAGKPPDVVKTEIISSYINNYDVIRVKFDSPVVLHHVKVVLQGLVGMEIIEGSGSVIVAKELLDMKEMSLHATLRRMDTIIRAMLDEFPKMRKGVQETLYEMDAEVNRLTWLALRMVRAAMENPRLLRMFETSYWDCHQVREMAVLLERFADQIKRMGRGVEEGVLRDKATKEGFLNLYAEVARQYAEIMKAYYGKERDAAYHREPILKKLLRDCDEFMERHRRGELMYTGGYMKHMLVTLIGITRQVMQRG